MEVVTTIILIAAFSGLATITYLSSVTKTKDSSAQNNVTQAAAALQTYYQQWKSYPPILSSSSPTISQYEPDFTFVDGSTSTGISTSPTVLSYFATSTSATLAALSDSGACIEITIYPTSTSTPDLHIKTTAINCYASNAITPSSNQW